MINSTHAIRSIFLGAAFFLSSACNSNDSAGTAPIVEVPAVSNKLMINGAVKSVHAGNATVSITVGSQTYQSEIPTDATGAFQIEIEQANDTDLVRLESFNPASDVRMISIAGNFKQLSEQAQSNQVNDVKISALSTAFFTLAEARNANNAISDAEHYLTLMSQVNTEDIITVATALKIVTDSINDVTLPSGYADTVELAKTLMNEDSTFIEDVELQHPGTYAKALAALLANTESAVKFSLKEQAGVFASDATDSLYALHQNGSGFTSSFDQASAKNLKSWSVSSQGDLVVDYDENEHRRDRLSLLLDSVSTKHTLLEQISLPNDSGYVSPTKFDFYKFADAFDSEALSGTYMLADTGSQKIELHANGTASRYDDEGDIQSTLSWHVDTKGRVVMSYASGDKTILTNLKDGRMSKPTLMTWVNADGSVKKAKVVPFERM